MIKEVRVDWREGWGNSARFEVLFDRCNHEDLKYATKEDLYLATSEDGYASFWAWHGPENNRGMSGREFDLPMKDGSTVTVKGPWSSNSCAVNEVFGPDILVTEANVTSDPVAWERGYTFMSGAVTVKALLNYIKAYPDCGFKIGLVKTIGGTYYLPIREDGTSKDPKDTVIHICE